MDLIATIAVTAIQTLGISLGLVLFATVLSLGLIKIFSR